MPSSVVVKRTTFVGGWLLLCGKFCSLKEKRVVGFLSDLLNGEFLVGIGCGGQNWLPCEKSRPCPDGEREKLPLFLRRSNLIIVISMIRSIFLVSVGKLIWSSVKRSSAILVILSILWISLMRRILMELPLSEPMAWSSFIIFTLGKSTSFFWSFLILRSFSTLRLVFFSTPTC